MSGHQVLVVGAGFSKPVGGPLLGELLAPDVIMKSRASQSHLQALAALADVQTTARRPFTLEELFTYVWRMRSARQPIVVGSEAWKADELYRQIEIHLADMCDGIKLDFRYTVARRYQLLMACLAANSKSLTILSFNYDMLVERACDAAGLAYDYGALPDLEIDDSRRRRALSRKGADVHILKLHGSSNWGVCRGCRKAEKKDDVILAYEDPYVPARRRSCPFCNDRFLATGIVPPILVKAGEIHHLDDTWEDASRALRRAREITVIGYSLPEGDLEATMLLSAANTTNLRRVETICGANGAPEIYRRLFGDKLVDTRMYLEGYLQHLEGELVQA